MDRNESPAALQRHIFHATVLGDQSGAYVEVPSELRSALGPARRPAVRVMINGVELRTTLLAYRGGAQIGLRREIREAAQITPGQTIEVSLELDVEPREVELPEELAVALDRDPDAKRIFEGLSFTNRKEYAGWVLAAKTPATRRQRVDETPTLLKSGRRSPLGKA